MNIIFAGTPDFSAITLQKLIASEHNVLAVYTQPDRPAGRGRQLSHSPVKALALESDIPVYQPLNFKQLEDQEIVSRLNADIMIVVAYGIILPQVILDAPQQGCLNIHASLLPKWRGAAPIQRAILAGDKQSGVTIMQMDESLDTGDMLLVKRCDISEQETGESLHDKLADIGADALLETLDNLASLYENREIQEHSLSSYAHKLDKKESTINWDDDALLIKNKVNAFNSWPVASTNLDNKVIRIWSAHVLDKDSELINDNSLSQESGQIVAESKLGIVVKCGQGFLCITELQLPGKKRIAVADFINSRSLKDQRFI